MGEDRLINRFKELAARAYDRSVWTETDFLSMAEQEALHTLRLDAPFTLYGGYEGAERRIAYFGSERDTGFPYEPPIACIAASPAHGKFSEGLTHRAVLGALMALGIERRTTGDILITEDTAYIFCLEGMAGYIMENLTSAGRTQLRCARSGPPQSVTGEGERMSFTVASERLDALISAVYRTGRSAAKELVASGRVYLNSRLTQDPDAAVPEGAIVSVRGMGRFRYEGARRTTKKGRLSVEAVKW